MQQIQTKLTSFLLFGILNIVSIAGNCQISVNHVQCGLHSIPFVQSISVLYRSGGSSSYSQGPLIYNGGCSFYPKQISPFLFEDNGSDYEGSYEASVEFDNTYKTVTVKFNRTKVIDLGMGNSYENGDGFMIQVPFIADSNNASITLSRDKILGHVYPYHYSVYRQNNIVEQFSGSGAVDTMIENASMNVSIYGNFRSIMQSVGKELLKKNITIYESSSHINVLFNTPTSVTQFINFYSTTGQLIYREELPINTTAISIDKSHLVGKLFLIRYGNFTTKLLLNY